jgi:parallel beta-helix repeat protein
MKRILFLSLATILTLSLIFTTAPFKPAKAETTWYVNPGESIQDAVDNAPSGATIVIKPGTYSEFVTISKTIAIEGEDKATTILEWTGDPTVKNGISIVETTGVDISNLTIRGYRCGVYVIDSQYINVTSSNLSYNDGGLYVDYSGIEADNSTDCTFSGNDIIGNEHGVILRNGSNENDVSNNSFTGNYWGLYLNSSTLNEVHDNQITGNGYGMSLQYSANYNSVYGNTITGNSVHGIHLYISSHNNIYGNTISENSQKGILCDTSCNYNTFSDNEVSDNGNNGIMITTNCSYNTISGNLIMGNALWGIALFGNNVNNTNVYNNTIENNAIGIKLFQAPDTTIINNNFIDNPTQFASTWSGIPTLSLPLPIGGNHWSDWVPPEHPDEDNDGIVDDARTLGYATDYFPYVLPNGWALNEPPVADAGPDQTVDATTIDGANVILDGSGSSDPDDDSLIYNWSWDEGTANGVSPTVSLPRGTTTVTLVVNDGTEDSAPDTVEITVVASVTGLAALVEQMFDEGWIDDPDIRDSLLDKINAATNKINQGKTKPAENILNAFINHINAQTGKHISPEAAEILIADAEDIIANL